MATHDRSALASPTRITVRTASEHADYVGAFELLERRYQEAGLTRRSSSRFRILPFQLWDETQLIVARQGQDVVGCVSVIRDSGRMPLPFDRLYPTETETLRGRYGRFGEITSLATERCQASMRSTLFVELTRVMVAYSRREGLACLVAAVCLRHARWYRRALGFELVGGIRRCDQVDGRPGIGICGNLFDPDRVDPRWRSAYFDRGSLPEDTSRRPIPHRTRELFRSLADGPEGQRRRTAG